MKAAGFTLVELIAVLAIVGLLTGVAGVAVAALKPAPKSLALARIEAARRTSILTGVPVRVTGDSAATCPAILFLPDGSAIGAKCRVDGVAVTVDPLSGAIRVAP